MRTQSRPHTLTALAAALLSRERESAGVAGAFAAGVLLPCPGPLRSSSRCWKRTVRTPKPVAKGGCGEVGARRVMFGRRHDVQAWRLALCEKCILPHPAACVRACACVCAQFAHLRCWLWLRLGLCRLCLLWHCIRAGCCCRWLLFRGCCCRLLSSSRSRLLLRWCGLLLFAGHGLPAGQSVLTEASRHTTRRDDRTVAVNFQ